MNTKNIKRIIVSRTDKIGDLILSIPSFFMIKKMFPEAELIVLVRKYNYEILKNLPYIDRILKIDDYRHEILLEKIKYFGADVFIALYNDNFISKLAKASKANYRIGPISKLSSFFVFNKGVFQKRSKSIKNEAEYNLDLVYKLNPEKYNENFEINNALVLTKENLSVANIFYTTNNIGTKTLVVNPFMGGSAKNISDSQYASLLEKIYNRVQDIDIILTCHISEEERGEKIITQINKKRVFLFANGGSILNLAAIIEKSKVFLGGSTGPTHIAGALKKDIVAIYPDKKTQHPIRWGTFNNPNTKYIIPDSINKSTKEKYSKKNKLFSSYNDKVEALILDSLEEKLNN
ncbi:glycosyltransferase family 9 protein [Fusobacterium sp. IOR10]|uniref:glycosyltransferase family 9 protein n=1 Tax=Fusobacterium sp. IOR10 TaxID=2665157 RepID=UPI0013D0D055|nr:glycosyltransferase family 9 protein [Fusobacterium sp. IOR10]